MMPVIICVFSLAALLPFVVSYFRSIVASSRNVELSPRLQEVTGISSQSVKADDFARLLQLVQLCPEQKDDQSDIRAVGAYYSILAFLGRAARSVAPDMAQWFEQERESCSHFAAVALDRRISHSRDLFSQQIADRL
jgi:hypothetical protein